MKNSLILTGLLLFCIIGHLSADNVKEDKARVAAQNWYRHYAPENKKSASVARFSEYKHNERTAFYIYNFDQGGFVLVSANDAVTPVLGYGFEHSAPEEIKNESVKGWFDNYARQIDTTFVLNLKNEEMTSKWQEVLENKIPVKNGNSVGPLLTTTWDQGCYYNEMCPEDLSGTWTCGHTWVGCTATAMAQILKYWNYPEGGVGYNSYIPRYNPQYGPQSVFFNEIDYDWTNMPSNLTSSNDAVATLMYHAGVSANMDYSLVGSGAYLYRAANGFRNNFDYSDSLAQLYRSLVTDSIWISTFQQNLNIGRPLLMEGFNSSVTEGHAWVCDGYQSDSYYHMNWGWSGSANGFYFLNNLTPGGYNFNSSQSVLINIVPNYSSLEANFYTIKNSLPLTLQFVDDSKGNPGSFQWQFGDSTVSILQNPIHSFPDSGIYQVCLIIVKGSVSDTIKKAVRVWKDQFLLTTQSMIGNDGKILAVDYNRDGYQDIINTGYMGQRCYQNNAGTIQNVPMNFPDQTMSPIYLHATDIENDGDPDIMLVGQHPMNASLDFLYYLGNDTLGYTIDTLENVSLITDCPFSFADCNGDGKVDLLLGNRLFRNVGNKKFYFQGLIGNEAGISAWEDYDLDGDIDVAIGSRIFNNQGNGIFTDVGYGFPSGSFYTWRYYNYEWGDYNQDGKPDLLVGGSIIKNLGNNVFEQIFPDNTPGSNKYCVWGDIDNDGDLDIITMSSGVGNGYLIYSTNIFINNNGSFQLSDSELQGVFGLGSIDWIDYDHDTKIDLLLEGYFPSDSTGAGNNWTSQLYKNFTDSINQPPLVPGGLSSVSTGNNVILSWNPSSDDKTFSGSLTYNLRIGTTLHGNEILSSLSEPVSGIRYVMERGNAGQSTSWKINKLINGKYFWSVQALDNSYAPSAFAQVDSFYVAGNNLPPDLFEMSQKVLLNTPSLVSLTSLLKAYYDPEGDSLKAIRINSLPVYGTLEYNGLPVIINQIIPIISLENLHYYTSVLLEDELYVTPYDGISWGESTAKLVMVVSPFEYKDIISTQPQLAFAWGDYDNDGDLDLASSAKIFKNNNGAFQDIGIELSGSGVIVWGDIDSDHDLDIIVGEKVYKNIGNDQFDSTQTLNPVLFDEASAFGDLQTTNTLDYLHSGSENFGNFVTKMYLNSGQGVFSDTASNIIGFRSGAVAWGDFDNDGDQDLAICGIYNDSNQRMTVIYRNENGHFTDIQSNLPGVNVGTLNWGDYDQDGDLDLLISGSMGTVYNSITQIFRNDHGVFTDINAILPGVFRGFANWVDIDSDGFLDIILGGFMDYPGRAIKLFKNVNGNYFTEIPEADLPALAYVSYAAGDYNNDGYPDFILSGINENNDTITALYRNCYGLETVFVNTPPSVPTNLHTTQTPAGVNLQWDKCTDNSTPQNTLSYNIYLSKYPDSVFVVSPMADLTTGYRKVPQRGNTSLNNFWHIDSLQPGTYYWSVQAIDNSFAGGLFAPQHSFTICSAPPPIADTIIGETVFCLPASGITYFVNPIEQATSYHWTLPPGATGNSSSNSITVNFSSEAASGEITVRGINFCGEGESKSLYVQLNSLPNTASNISGNNSVCIGGSNIVYSIDPIQNATSYIWTLPPGANGSSTSNSISVSFTDQAVTGEISVLGHNDCGEGEASSLFVQVNSLPDTASAISGNNVVCQGNSSVVYTINPIQNATSYLWELTQGATGSSTTNSISVSFGTEAVSGEISVKGINSCGEGDGSTLPITVNPLPMAAGVISGSSIVCQGQNAVAYTVPAISNATSYVWTLPNGANGTSTTNSISVDYSSSATSGNITVKGINSCGEGAGSSLAVTVNSTPMTAGVISGSSIACQGQNAVVYTVPVIVNATSYEWTLPNGASGTSITNSILVNFGSEALSGEIIVKGVNNCGEGEEARLFVQVDPLPEAAASINGTAVVCAGAASIYYSTPDIPYADSYNWTLPPGFFGNSTTNSIEVYYSNQALSGNITVTGVNDCGEGEEASLFVQVNPLPEEPPIPIGPDEVDLKIVTETVYKTLQVQNATHYFWELEPFTMGEISSQGDSAVITWSGQLGIATLKVSGWNSICEYGPWSEVKSIWVDFSFGIDETGIKGVIVFPNPSDGIFTVKTEFPMESVLMKNAAGKTVLRPKLVDSYQIDVDANRFAKGIYFLEITHRYGKERVKLVLY